MATVPTGYVFWDVSAKKSYAAGTTFPALGDGDYLAPASTSTTDGYYHGYIYHTSYMYNNVQITNGWNGAVQSGYSDKTSYVAPFNTIADKPVMAFAYSNCNKMVSAPNLSGNTNLRTILFQGCTALTSVPTIPAGVTNLTYSFQGCTALTSAPTIPESVTILKCTFFGCTALTSAPSIPANVTDMDGTFYGCTALTSAPTIPSNVTVITNIFLECVNLTGVIYINATDLTYSGAFYNTELQIILLGAGATTAVAQTGNKGNVYVGVKALIKSFKAIRCDSTGTEKATGEYCLFQCTFTAPSLSGSLLKIPVLQKSGVDVSAAWHVGSLSGSEITAAGVDLGTGATIFALINLVSGDESSVYSINVVTSYESYTFVSSVFTAALTYKKFIIDITPDGTKIGIGMEAPEDEGLHVGMALKLHPDSDTEIDYTITSAEYQELVTLLGG